MPEDGSETQKYPATFSHLISFIERVGQTKPHQARQGAAPTASSSKTLERFQHWAKSLERPHPPRLGVIVFRLLFPQEDTRRKYELQEARLGKALAEVLGSLYGNAAQSEGLVRWADTQSGSSVGCLGDEVRRIMNQRTMNTPGKEISLHEIDTLLDELASHSAFSDRDVPKPAQRRDRNSILRDLYKTLTPFGAACMTQIILKDLRPLLYPLASTRSTLNLLEYKSNAVHELTIQQAMRVWHPVMPKIYHVRASLDAAANAVERYVAGASFDEIVCPQVGTQIEIPKCLKGEGCRRVVNTLRAGGHSPTVWAETKYDGERMQIHVDLSRAPEDQIKIFSKSKRDSTLDRMATHPIIQAALGLPVSLKILGDPSIASLCSLARSKPRIKTSVIVEAEMVCYNEDIGRIDEFWRIRSLLDSTAVGARKRFHASRVRSAQAHEDETADNGIHQDSLESNASAGGTRHFMLVFFDVLHIDGQNLLDTTYEARRTKLESLIRIIPNITMLAERKKIDLDIGDPAAELRKVFAERVTDFEEGLVLKPGCSKYNDFVPGLRWIKLKKDYIPGLGDTIDVAIVGASWDKDRGRELRVGPETYTTFYVGTIDKAIERRRGPRSKVHIEVLFSASYGLSREQLDDFNWELRQSRTVPYNAASLNGLSYTVELAKGLVGKPAVLFSEPRLVELMGAGFTKSTGSKHYELRFPRLTKIWNPRERTWLDGVDLEEFHRIACASIGNDPPQKRTSDVMKQIWALPVSPGARSLEGREDRLREWVQKLAAIDGPPRANRKRAEISRGEMSPAKRARPLRTSNVPTPPPSSPSPVIHRTEPENQPPETHDNMLGSLQLPSPRFVSRFVTPETSRHFTPAIPLAIPTPQTSPLRPTAPPRKAMQGTLRRFQPVDPAPPVPPVHSGPDPVSMVQPASPIPKPKPLRASKSLPQPTTPSKRDKLGKESRKPSRRLRISRSESTIPTLASLYTLSRKPALPIRPAPQKAHSMPSIPTKSQLPSGTQWNLDGALYYVQSSSKTTFNPSRLSAEYPSQRLSTLEGLLWGISGSEGATTEVEKGFIFIDKTYEERLQAITKVVEEARLTRNLKPLYIFDSEDLPYFYRHLSSSASRPIQPLWSSCT